MSQSTNQIDELTLDELVTGNLRGERYRQTIKALDREPSRWRDCALAFLHEQALSQELRAIAQSDVDWTDEAAEQMPASGNLGEGSTAVPPLPEVTPAESTEASWAGRDWLQKLTTLAALLLISFSIGWLGAGFRGGADVGEPGESLIGATKLDPSISGGPSLVNDDGSPTRTDSATTRNQPFQLVRNQFMSIDREVPASLRELERRGRVRIESYDAIVPVELDDGASALVPVQQFRVVPVVQSY